MNVFITGSNGFIGKHLKESLAKNYSQYKLFCPTSTTLDLINEKAVDSYIISNKIDIIIHLANRGGDQASQQKNIAEYNLRIFFNIVKHEKNVKKIISLGSGAEYGKHKPIIDAIEEDYLKLQPLDEYGLYKSITSKYIEKSKNIIQLRVFGAYGEYENYKFRFISNAIVKNLLQLPITINQNVIFDYIYIDDLIQMIIWFIINESEYKIYNATSGVKIDLLSLASIINEISSFKSKIHLANGKLNNEYTSSNQRLVKELKNLKFTSHKDAIRKMYLYFKKNLNNLEKDFFIKNKTIEINND